MKFSVFTVNKVLIIAITTTITLGCLTSCKRLVNKSGRTVARETKIVAARKAETTAVREAELAMTRKLLKKAARKAVNQGTRKMVKKNAYKINSDSPVEAQFATLKAELAAASNAEIAVADNNGKLKVFIDTIDRVGQFATATLETPNKDYRIYVDCKTRKVEEGAFNVDLPRDLVKDICNSVKNSSP